MPGTIKSETEDAERETPRENGVSGWRRGLRIGTGGVLIAYGVGLTVLCLAMQLVGEQNVTIAFLLYLPQTIWLLPAPFLILIGLGFHRRLTLLTLGFLLVWVWLGMGYRMNGAGGKTLPQTNNGALKVITYNRGQHGGQSFQPFKNQIQPELICFQEAGARASTFQRDPGYAEFTHAVSAGEHTLLSRLPILESSQVPPSPGSKSSRAARFVVDWHGKKVAVYSVHLQTPRDTLRSLGRGGFLYGVLGFPGTPWNKKKQLNQVFWNGQIADAEHLLTTVRDDPLPVVVAGDFNAPSVGWIYQRIRRELQDAHAEAGRGFGFTFPGQTRNPLSLGGPWLRIDYVFASPAWQVLSSVAEEDRGSQHRAVAATLRLKSPEP